MGKYCLIKSLADEFKSKLASGEINPDKLIKMTSKERSQYFSDMLGENNGKNVNALFESKLLAKNTEHAMISWAKEVTGIRPEVRQDLITKINKWVEKGDIFNPKTEEAFLQDLASTRLGTDITYAEATKITELSENIKQAESKDLTNFKNRVEYGNKLMEMEEYVNSLNPNKAGIAVNLLNLPRALMASTDFSAPFIQGWGMLSRPQFYSSFGKMFQVAFSERKYKDLMADILTRPNADLYKKSGLRITKLSDKLSQREEVFMTNLLDKIPVMKGSQRAYTGFLNKLRADTFDSLIRSAELKGEDIGKNSKVVKDIANTVNDFTGSGNIGKGDKYSNAVPVLNNVFFSPRKISAMMNMFNPARYLDPKISSTARQAAFRNLIGSTAITATILGIASLNNDVEIEKDPTSSDFGKVKIGDTRLDFSGGNAGYLTLLSRLITGKTKSTNTELVKELGKGFGVPTRADISVKYFRNKLSPVASYFVDWAYGSNAIGEPFNADKDIANRLIPLSIKNSIEAFQNDPDNALLGSTLNIFGVNANVYNNNEKWENTTSKELLQFKSKVGDDKFKEANDKYNQFIDDKLTKLKDSDKFKGLSDDDKQSSIKALKERGKKDIFKQYNFTYKQDKKSSKDSKDKENLIKNL